jgi:Ser/Thr protein kinase RdoA (MazF antagonist)
MEALLRNWNIGSINTIEPIVSYWGKTSLVKTVDEHYFILKEKADSSQAEQESHLLAQLSKVGAPVAVPIRTINGTCYASSAGKIFCLYPRLPGAIIAHHYADDAAGRAQRFGQAIAFLHTCLRKCNPRSGFPEMKLVEQIHEWALPCIRRNSAIVEGDTIERIWGEVAPQMASLYPELPQQLIHRDLNPANMLFQAGELTGFVDFDMVVHGPRLFDLCYCASSILVSGFQDPTKVAQWPRLLGSLVRGYQEVVRLVPSEQQALYGTLAAIQLLFMAFSLETHAEGAARCNASVLKWLSVNRALLLV